jgi:hypothetical protein
MNGLVETVTLSIYRSARNRYRSTAMLTVELANRAPASHGRARLASDIAVDRPRPRARRAAARGAREETPR